MSESRLELRVLVLRAFTEKPHLFGNIIFFSLNHLILLLSWIRPTRSYLCLPGVIPKGVMDSMEFLANFKISNDAKKGNGRRHSFKGKQSTSIFCLLLKFFYVLLNVIFFLVIRSVKTMPWVQGRSRVRPTVSCPEHRSTSGDRKPIRRSLGLETFPNVLMFRSYVPCKGKNNTQVASLLACTDS